MCLYSDGSFCSIKFSNWKHFMKNQSFQLFISKHLVLINKCRVILNINWNHFHRNEKSISNTCLRIFIMDNLYFFVSFDSKSEGQCKYCHFCCNLFYQYHKLLQMEIVLVCLFFNLNFSETWSSVSSWLCSLFPFAWHFRQTLREKVSGMELLLSKKTVSSKHSKKTLPWGPKYVTVTLQPEVSNVWRRFQNLPAASHKRTDHFQWHCSILNDTCKGKYFVYENYCFELDTYIYEKLNKLHF